jgi:hypothetical protein
MRGTRTLRGLRLEDSEMTMHLRIATLIALVVAAIPHTSTAQEPDEVTVVRAATLFVRDSLGQRPLVIDSDYYRTRPTLNRLVADRVAAELGMTRGRVEGMVRCAMPDGAEARGQVCTMRGGKATIVALSQPTIRGDSAEIHLTYIFLDDRGRVSGESLMITLGRSSSGDWRVERADVTGVS